MDAPLKSVAVWDCVEEKFQKRLALWKGWYISKGGRRTPIHSTLSSLPIYFMSLFCMLRLVGQRLGQIQRDFLWGGGALERRPHLVSWSVVLFTHKGSLRVRNLSLLNKALLCKWN